MNISSKTKYVVSCILMLLAGFALGVVSGNSYLWNDKNISDNELSDVPVLSVTGRELPPAGVDFSPLWKSWRLIDEKFVNGKATTTQVVDSEEKVLGAVAGLVDSLGDPYSVFFPPEEAEEFQENISGSFSGVGMEVGIRSGQLTVIAPLEGTPAKRAGIRPGDKIVAIDGKSTLDLTVDKAVKLIRGEVGTKVTLTIERDGFDEVIEVPVVREVIEIPVLELGDKKPGEIKGNAQGDGLRDDGVFVIRLYSFSANSPDLFRQALRKFVLSGSDKLLLDLRGNPGGYLETAVDIASWFLPEGKVVVTEVAGKSGEEKTHRSKGYDIFNDKLKFVILVDKGSASASEILAGALSEHGKAKLVGEKTFGKGSVQELIPVTENTFIKLTIAKWLTPKGVSISDGGLTPNIEVKINKEDIEQNKDPQFDRAIDLLVKGQ